MNTPGRVGLVQLCATHDVAANVARCLELIRDAAAAGAGVILLPEACTFIGPDAEKRAMLEPVSTDPITSPLLAAFSALAKELAVELLIGHHECGPASAPEKSYNTLVHLDRQGAVQSSYRKIHLFDVDLPDGTQLKESAKTLPGTEIVTTETTFGTLGLSICYDVRFPTLYQALASRGAVALCVPSAFTAATGAAHWHTLLRARAIETQCFVLAPAQHGAHNKKRRSYGHSLIVDPWGEIIAEGADGDGVVTADLNLERLSTIRRQLPSLEHRVDLGS
ncbi:MAG: carbon-nitrogen hydrolase family protein [Pseudomonadota bacterium]